MPLTTTDFLTADEAAAILKVSKKTVIRRFANHPGVLDLGTPGGRFKSRRRVLRIPRYIFDKFCVERLIQ